MRWGDPRWVELEIERQKAEVTLARAKEGLAAAELLEASAVRAHREASLEWSLAAKACGIGPESAELRYAAAKTDQARDLMLGANRETTRALDRVRAAHVLANRAADRLTALERAHGHR